MAKTTSLVLADLERDPELGGLFDQAVVIVGSRKVQIRIADGFITYVGSAAATIRWSGRVCGGARMSLSSCSATALSS